MFRKLFDQPIYIASLLKVEQDDNGNNKNIYDTPFSVDCAPSPLSGSQDLLAYGERIFKMYRAVLDKNIWNNKIKEGDVAYLEGITPMRELVNGSDANYRVVSVRYGFMKINVYFERGV